MAPTLRGSIRIKNRFSPQWLCAISGSLIISAWTLLRFFDHGPNFDQVGQQVLAHQWLHGLHAGSVVGPTNYVFKMLFLYMPIDLLNLPAQFKLVFMTLLVNIVTFLLLVYVLRKIWQEFYPNVKESFYLPLIYLSLIAGSVFWISFSNSRNLEVVAGLYLIYLYLRAQSQPTNLYYGLIVLVGSVLFFSDPLQIYMTLLPALIYIFARWTATRNNHQLRILLKIIGCSLVALLLSRLLIKVAAHLWSVSFISTTQSPRFSLSSIKLAAEQVAKLYAGGYEAGRIREAVDLLAVGAVIAGTIYACLRKPKSRWLIGLVVSVWIVDLVVYIVSGQAQQSDTNRYLIMTVPMFILAMAVALYYTPKKKIVTYVVVGLLLFNLVTLARAFTNSWNPHFTNNSHERSAINYINQHNYRYGYASIGTALSSDFLSNEKIKLLPLGCEPNQTLKKTTLFFDKAGFNISKQQAADSIVPIVLDSNIIKINQAACAPEQIRRQLGPESTTDHLSDGSTVLLYRTSQLNSLPS